MLEAVGWIHCILLQAWKSTLNLQLERRAGCSFHRHRSKPNGVPQHAQTRKRTSQPCGLKHFLIPAPASEAKLASLGSQSQVRTFLMHKAWVAMASRLGLLTLVTVFLDYIPPTCRFGTWDFKIPGVRGIGALGRFATLRPCAADKILVRPTVAIQITFSGDPTSLRQFPTAPLGLCRCWIALRFVQYPTINSSKL